MVFPLNHPDASLRGQPKGLQVVLSEHKLWREGLYKKCKRCEPGATNCCAITIMSNEPDFLAQKCQLKKMIIARGHKGLQDTVPNSLDSVSLTTIQHFSRKAFRYMNIYRKSLTKKAAEFAVKKYHSHRRVPDSIFYDI
ncbi:14295_t:CDS:2, partial [Cetraspora pellucida]